MITVYVIIYVIISCALSAGGYVLGTERRYHIEDEAVDYDFFKEFCTTHNYTDEQRFAVYETMYEVRQRLA